MSLDSARLEKVRPLPDGGYLARCPACALEGGDHHGQHLRVFPDGKYACAAVAGSPAHRKLIWALAGAKGAGGQSTRPPRAKVRQANFERKWKEAAEREAKWIFRTPWPPQDIRKASPGVIPDDPRSQSHAILLLFRPDDIVWIGDLRQSGRWRHHSRFRTVEEWMRTYVLHGPRICPATFRPDVISRSKRTVLDWRFLVIESDSLPLQKQGALIWWCMGFLKLRAVVNTAGRSLHAWFDLPDRPTLARLEAMLPQLGCDPALFNPAQPVRLPGWPRADTGAIPTLIYLNP